MGRQNDIKQLPTLSEALFGRVFGDLDRRIVIMFVLLLFLFGFMLIVWWQQRSALDVTRTSVESVARATQSISQATESSEALTEVDPAVIAQSRGGLVANSASPSGGDVAGSFNSGLTINPDSVALETDTTGNYVQGLVAGSGLTGSANSEGALPTLAIGGGDGISVSDDGLSVSLGTGGGLAFSDGSLTLLNSCADDELLKWDSGSNAWACGSDNAGAGSLTIRETDGSPSANPISTIEFGPPASSSDEFIITDQGGGIARVRLGSTVLLTGSSPTLTGSWTFSSAITANGGLACSSCIALGSETSGDYLATLSAGTGLSVSGSGGEGATPTVSLDSAIAIFKTIAGDSGTAVADGTTDTITIAGGNGLTSTAADAPDSLTLDIDLATGGGLTFASGQLTLLECLNGEILKRSGGAWGCNADNASGDALATAFNQILSGTDNVTVGAAATPLITNGGGTAQNVDITITAGDEVHLTATAEISSTLGTGSATYSLVRDDNGDNDCGTGGGDGTQIGGSMSIPIATTNTTFVTSFSFIDASPVGTSVSYQLCASTSIIIGIVSVTDRSLILREANI